LYFFQAEEILTGFVFITTSKLSFFLTLLDRLISTCGKTDQHSQLAAVTLQPTGEI